MKTYSCASRPYQSLDEANGASVLDVPRLCIVLGESLHLNGVEKVVGAKGVRVAGRAAKRATCSLPSVRR